MRLIKAILVLAVLGFAALSGYAYFGEFTPPESTQSTPIELPAASNAD